MSDHKISQEIRTFIARYIDSVAELEALLLLRANPEEAWSIAMVAQRLYIPAADAAEVLRRLTENGFLSAGDAGYTFACAVPELAQGLDRLAETYARQLVAVTNIIHAKPRRIRQFADAFKFRKDH